MTIGIILIVSVSIVGLIDFLLKLNKLKKTQSFILEYRNNFRLLSEGYFKNQYIDFKSYEWLTKNAYKIQDKIGHFENLSIKPPFANYIINDYQIILNTIPKFTQGVIRVEEMTMLDDSLTRAIGKVDTFLDYQLKILRNPFRWFFNGIKTILALPIKILYWSGLMAKGTTFFIEKSLIFRALSGFIGLTSLIGSIASIIAGEKDLILFFKKILSLILV